MTLARTGVTPSIASSGTATTPAVPNGSVGDVILWSMSWGTPSADGPEDRPTLTGAGAAGATHRGSAWGGGGTWGVDAGGRGHSFWSAVATSTLGADDAITFTLPDQGTGAVVAGFAVRLSRDTAKSLEFAHTSGADTNGADGWAPAGFTNIGATTGDYLLIAYTGVPDTPNVTATVAWTGATLSQAGILTGAVTAGHDLRQNLRDATVTAGTSTAAPTVSSATTGSTGVQTLLRVREVDPPAAVMNAGTDQADVEHGTTVTLDSSASTGSSARTWTQAAGTTVTLSATSATSLTFTTPVTLAGATLTFRVTDNASGAFDDVTVTVLPTTERVVVGGVEVPANLFTV